MTAFRAVGSEPNPHALAALVKASETYSIVASRDIVDVRGMKLWAKHQPVSASLHQRLLERRLEQPLETCLEAEDGVTMFKLHDDLKVFIESGAHPLGVAVRPWAKDLLAQVKQLPLHPVVQLMLTASVASRPGTLPHAVAGMALAGALMASRGNGAVADIRLAMLGGLLHDIGEVYIHPQYLDYTQSLDLVGHKHLVVHPRVGQLLLSHLTDYPKQLATAIGEHHERMDCSGYPARLRGDELSEQGRLLAVMEVPLGIARWDHAPLSRASFALRVVPGEFDMRWASFICDAADRAGEDVSSEAALPAGADLERQLADIDQQLADARQLAMDMHEQRRTDKVTDVVNHALERLHRLRQAWNALGLWAVTDASEVPAAECFELQLAQAELSQRMRNFQRECLLLSEGLSEAEKFRLSPLWRGLFEGRY